MSARQTGLFSKSIVIHDDRGEGQQAEALLAVCRCGCDRFCAYLIQPGGHLHFQCLDCGESYCDGSCSRKGK